MGYRVFKRAWWTKDASGNIIPHGGARKTTLAYVRTEEEARDYCRDWNKTAPNDWRSMKAEYEGG